ncbi:hypothetical protein NB311A_14040 [Nitrobacter sp. Nb-311A]|nr:hypothetical protein NB311A_14040 [Nitrobacter sp. Nb-311A]
MNDAWAVDCGLDVRLIGNNRRLHVGSAMLDILAGRITQ